MGPVRRDLIALGILLVLLFWVRMELANTTPSLSYESYLTVRQVEHIQNTGWPMRDDPLSITGAKRVINPVFDYLLALALIFTSAAYKLLPNLFMVLLLVPLYFLTLRLTQSKTAGFIAVILAATGPAVFSGYLITPNPSPVAFFLLLSILAMIHDTDKYIFHIIICAILLAFLSPVIFILAFGLLIIILLLRMEGFGVDRRINEMFFFTLLLSLWFYVIVYKQALFTQGVQVVWQNLPAEVARLSFRNATFIDAINGLGVITFLFGVFGTYYALFEARDKSTYTIIGALLAVTIAIVARIVPVAFGLILLTFFLSVVAGYGLVVFFTYVKRTKFPRAVYVFGVLLLALFVFTAILPSLVGARTALRDSPTPQDIVMFQSLQEQLPPSAILLTTVDEAAAIQYYTNRTTLTDQDFLLVTNGDELVADIDAVYTARFGTTVMNKAQKLGFTHILLSRAASEHYGRDRIYIEGKCINEKRIKNAALYTITCGDV